MTVTITADDIRRLYGAQFAPGDARGTAALVVRSDGDVVVESFSAADDEGPDARIVLADVDLHAYCDGELDDALAEQLAADLTAGLAESED